MDIAIASDGHHSEAGGRLWVKTHSCTASLHMIFHLVVGMWCLTISTMISCCSSSMWSLFVYYW